MSAGFEVSASMGSYSVSIEPGSLTTSLARYHTQSTRPSTQCFVIADVCFREHPLLQEYDADAIAYYQASEAAKTLEAVPALIERARKCGANRETRFIAIGGGTIQDLACFAASIYMRGVQWIYLPTTLLGMVDSCIGGKSSVNVGSHKNLVGTFHPPSHVIVDPEVVSTLALDQQASGLIEAAKICFCRGLDCFRRYLAYNPRSGMDPSALADLIVLSLEAKKWFIEIDEFDQKERLLLNFGHTFGHAIEGASGYRIPHGIAVGLGILCALAFGRQAAARFNDPYAAAPAVGELEEHICSLLRFSSDLPSRLATLPLDDVIEHFASDKKHTQTQYVLLLVTPSGSVVIEGLKKSAASLRRIRRAIASVFEGLAEEHTH